MQMYIRLVLGMADGLDRWLTTEDGSTGCVCEQCWQVITAFLAQLTSQLYTLA